MLAPDGGMFTTGGLSAKVIADTTAATHELLNAAKAGGFKISEEGVKPMREALLQVRNDLESLGDVSFRLTQAPQLGNHPYGHTVAAHDQKGASVDANSAGRVLEELKQMVIEADEALARAAGVYKENESQAVEAMKGS
jgi:hypothetical protein